MDVKLDKLINDFIIIENQMKKDSEYVDVLDEYIMNINYSGLSDDKNNHTMTIISTTSFLILFSVIYVL